MSLAIALLFHVKSSEVKTEIYLNSELLSFNQSYMSFERLIWNSLVTINVELIFSLYMISIVIAALVYILVASYSLMKTSSDMPYEIANWTL